MLPSPCTQSHVIVDNALFIVHRGFIVSIVDIQQGFDSSHAGSNNLGAVIIKPVQGCHGLVIVILEADDLFQGLAIQVTE